MKILAYLTDQAMFLMIDNTRTQIFNKYLFFPLWNTKAEHCNAWEEIFLIYSLPPEEEAHCRAPFPLQKVFKVVKLVPLRNTTR